METPATIVMIDHLMGHAAIDANIFPCDESGLVRAKEKHHLGDVLGRSHPPRRVLLLIGPEELGSGGVDPTGGDGVDPGFVP